MTTTRLVAGDTQPTVFTVTYTVNSQAVDLTGATCSLKLTHRKTAAVTTVSCAVTDAAAGKCTYDPGSSGYPAGEYSAELQITLASTKIRTYPDIADSWLISVREDA